jgi:hypothetical protein
MAIGTFTEIEVRSWQVVIALTLVTLCAQLTAAPISDPQKDSISERECRDFATTWISAIESGELERCDRLYDCDAFVGSMLGKLNFHYVEREQVLKKWTHDLRESHMLYAPVVALISAGGSLHVLSVHPESPSRHVIARSIGSDGALNYVLLSLKRTASGGITVADCQFATSGGSLRDMLGAMVAHFAPYEGDDGKIVKNAPNAELLILDKRILAGMNDNWKQGKFMEVIHLYGQLSPEMRTDRYPLLLAIGAGIAMYDQASQNGPTEFAKSFDRSVDGLSQVYRKTCPGDATIDVYLIDHYTRMGRFESAQNSIDAVDKWIGGDPYLDTLRAGLLFVQRDLKTARATAEKSLLNGSDVAETYALLTAIASEQGDESRVSELKNAANKKFGATLSSESTAIRDDGRKNSDD